MRKFFSFFAALLFAGSMMAETYNKTAYADLKTGDEVIITMENASGIFAASNDKGTSAAPVATAVTVTDNAITTDATNILWTIAKDGDNISFYVGEAALYCTNTNNGMRVGSNANNVFSIDATSGYLYNNATSRFIGVYNNQDWRCYTSVNTNIQGQTLAFFVKASGTTPVDPTPEPATTVYDWAGNVGTTVLGGNSNIAVATVKIHTNADEVASLKFGSSYVYADGKWVAIKPAEGAFKAGDTIKTSVVFNNSDDTKYCMVDAYAADGSTRIWRTDSATTINGRTSAADPAIQTYVLEADQDSIFLGRYGNTTMMVTLLQVVRPAGVTPVEPATEPAAAPAAPTYPANQVKAVYSATYNADCNFGEWGSGTAYTQETVGKKYVTTGLGYFGLEFAEHLNCAKMEKLHMDVWVAADASIRIVPIWGGTEQGIAVNLVGQQWNAVELALTAFDQVTNWTDVYQIKIDNAANLTFWLNNVYFYTTVAPAADTEAPTAVAASLVSASYFSAKISATATDNSDAVIFVVKDGENELATAPAVSGVAKEITVNGLLPNTAYNFSVIAKDEAGNAADPVAVVATTLAAPAPATAPTYAADKVLAVQTDAYTNIAYDIQDWWSMPAVTKGNLTATSKALCLEPNTTPSSCFGLTFAPTDITAYDSLEMDVYATTEGSKIKIQVIGDNANLPAATEYTLVANQWNHIVLNIKGNTKNNCEQIGFYDCNNITGALFIQNVLFVDNDAPVVTGPTNCAEAAEAALSVANNNDLYNDGAVYSITGYVTSIQTAYNAQYNNVSFWMADAADGGNVIEAYRAACASADDAPIVGDKVTVTGSLTKYNTTPEFAAGCTYVIVEHATPAVPVNLGEKTIAEFIALANTVDTCVITGVVANIKKNTDGSYNKYGNFDLVDGESSVYVYGLLTADGVAQKFVEMGIDENDTLTVKAVYSLYNNAPQAKNAVFVAVKKAAVVPPVEGDTINVTIATGVEIYPGEGYWQVYAQSDNALISIVAFGDGLAGTYAAEDFYSGYSFVMTDFENKTKIAFTAGELVVTEEVDGSVTFVGMLTGEDGNVYNVNLTYREPKAEQTVTLTYDKAELDDQTASEDEYFDVTGVDYTSMTMVALSIYSDAVAGTYTEADLDPNYSYIYADGGYQTIYSAQITVVANADGSYTLTAALLCYNNTLYNVTMTIPAQEEGFESVDAAVKAVKKLINGNVVIEKGGKKYNVNGARL